MSLRPLRRRAALLLISLALLPSCSPADAPPPDVVRRDSAGIEIVESLRPAWGDSARWRVDPAPLLDLAATGTGPEHQFYGVAGMGRLSDGTIVVANRGSQEVRWFTAGGRFSGAVGGHGEGPGEFDNLQQVEFAADTVLALDFDETIALFAPGPRLIRVLRTRNDGRSVHFLEGGSLVVPTLLARSYVTGLVRDPEALLLYDLEGAPGDSIGQLPGVEEYSNEYLSSAPLFPKRPVVDTRGGSIFTGASDFMQVEELSAAGDTLRILRIPGYPLELTEAQVEAEREARLNIPLPQGMTMPPPFRQAIEDMPSPTMRPAYDRMIVDPSGAAWLRHFTAESEKGGPERWLVFGPGGEWLGEVAFPPRFGVLDIGTDEVLGVWSDELDVQHPRVLRLIR